MAEKTRKLLKLFPDKINKLLFYNPSIAIEQATEKAQANIINLKNVTSARYTDTMKV